jgi:hypothetical protein
MRKFAFKNGIAAALVVAASLASGLAFGQEVKVVLSGGEEIPSIATSASGNAIVTVGPDMSVTVKVTTSGIAATASHIHMAPAGQNGPVIVPFVKNGDGFSTAAGAKLTEAQFAAFKAGNLYVNVHSAANPGGEIRGQIRP